MTPEQRTQLYAASDDAARWLVGGAEPGENV